jgi:hypothetical protein
MDITTCKKYIRMIMQEIIYLSFYVNSQQESPISTYLAAMENVSMDEHGMLLKQVK